MLHSSADVHARHYPQNPQRRANLKVDLQPPYEYAQGCHVNRGHPQTVLEGREGESSGSRCAEDGKTA